MAGLDDQMMNCPALVVHYKVSNMADRFFGALDVVAAKDVVTAKRL